jgi:hypothetical protein
MKKVTLGILTLLCLNLSAQDYFQQEVNYTIDVELNDENHTLNGMEYIDYTNNSPNDLGFIWFHLWPNAYKDNSTALCKQKVENGSTSLYYASENERGNINGLNFKVDGKIVRWDYNPEHIDICKLILNKPIRAGESIRITTPFFVKIPDAKFSRLGHVDQSYMITQWYPKPAVYDNDGWHPMPYLDQGEFYSEFGSFDVSITLPSNYTVGATGDLQNIGEINRLNQLAKATDTITKFSDDLSFPLSDLTTKTLRYTQNNIHDFGWFADKRFHVLKGEVEVPHTKEKITLWTMFTNNEADLWKNSIEYMHDAVYYYSLWNGDYPYKQCTAVDGTISAGGGMEYPNVTVIGESATAYLLEEVIMHEVGHNWFYGMLGNNERLHPWMDEGLNSHNEMRYMRTKYPDYNMFLQFVPKRIKGILDLEYYTNKQVSGELMYMMNAWTGKDQPIELHSAEYTEMNYGGIVYSKTAIVFDYLMAYLGEDVYDKCMQTYFERWQYKHPQPEDLSVVFEEISGKNLSWFFEDVIKTTKQLDYSIIGIQKETKDLLITLENKGDIVGPVVISGVKDAKSMSTLWIDGFEGKKVCRYFNGDYDHIRIDYYGDMPETNRNNNIMRIKGMFKTLEPIRPQIIGSMYHPEKTQVFFTPMIDYNVYNRYSYGLIFYNRFIPKEGLSYKITPMYSNGSKNLSGSLNLTYSKFNRESNIYNYKISLDAKKAMYDYGQEYIRFEPKLDITLKKSSLRSKRDNYLSASYVHLEKEEETLAFIKGNYTYSNARTFNPYSIHMQIEKGDEYSKASLILNYNYHINQKKRLNIRGYFGYVSSQNNIYDLQMSAWNGTNDYTFSEKALVRDNLQTNKLPYQQQIFIKEGGLKHFTNLTSNNWLSSCSAEYNLTKIFRLYLEAGTNGVNFAYGSGLRIPLLRNMLNFYLPLYTEEGLVKFDKSYQDVMRFNLNIRLILNFF